MRLSPFFIVAAFLASAQACSPKEDDQGSESFFRSELQPIFQNHCTWGCHVPEGYADELHLGNGYGPETLVNVPSTQVDMMLIAPGSLEESYLWHKLNNTHLEVGGEGEHMPYEDWPLSPAELDAIRDYILMIGE